LKQYSQMKDSEIEWIGKIPKHWKNSKYKFLTSRVIVGIAEGSTHAYVDDGIPLIRSTNVRPNHLRSKNLIFINTEFAMKNTSKSLKENDILTVRTGYPGVSAIVPRELNDSQCFTLLISTPRKKQSPYFLCNWLNSDIAKNIFEIEGWGAAQINISVSILKNIPIFEPPFEEQKQIADYLDKKTKIIDNEISKNQKLIKSLKEKRQSVINHTVTKGLDDTVSMKKSKIPGIGKIPEHWIPTKLKFYTTKIGSGITPKGGADSYVKEGIPLIRSQNVHFDGLHLDDVAYITLDIHKKMSNSKILENDVLLNITGASIGRTTSIPKKFGEANVNQHVCIIRTNQKLYHNFLTYFLTSSQLQTWISAIQVGASREGLTFEEIKNFIILLPSNLEQKQIADYLDSKITNINSLISKIKLQIKQLQEFRETLISSSVTGKIKVAEA